MDKLIERVARAIANAQYPDELAFDDLSPETRDEYLRAAKAAIEASGVERAVEALTACRDRFDEYVKMHRAKLLPARHPDEFYQNARTAYNREVQEKIDRNQEMVEVCDETLSLINGVEK